MAARDDEIIHVADNSSRGTPRNSEEPEELVASKLRGTEELVKEELRGTEELQIGCADMIYPELRNIRSADLEPPAMPADPLECEVHFEITVGPKDDPEQGDTFTFAVVTAAYLARYPGAQWGRGKMIVPGFDWQLVITAVARLLAECSRPTWRESAEVLGRELIPVLDIDDQIADA